MDKLNSNSSVIKSKRPFEHLMKIKTEGNNWGILKTLLVLFLFLVEIALVVVNAVYVVSFIGSYSIFAGIITMITCFYVLSSNKNSQSKAVWIMFLIVFFSFGYIIYWLSDERVFFRRQKKRYDEIFKRSYNFQTDTELPAKLNPQIKCDANYFKQAGNFACYTGTNAEYYPSGSSLFDEVLKAISSAEKFIFMEFFIISDGALLKRLEKILEQKCKDGVDVRIIYDDMGSHRTFSLRTRKRLKNMGVKIYRFNQLISWFSFGLNYRDHRKIVVVDGKIGFTGGANFADEYTNDKRMHGYWKDCGIKLVGPAVDSLTLTFLRQWAFVSKEETEFSSYVGIADRNENNSIYIPFADGLEYKKNIGKDAYLNIIYGAKEKLYIMTPYFIIDDVVFDSIKAKALSGVDVRIILPDIPDKKAVYRVSRNTAEKLAAFGVKLYVMKHSFVHSKIALNESAVVLGSINFDLRSFYQQFENAVYTNDKKVLKQIEEDFSNTFKVSTKIDKQNSSRRKLKNRVMAGILGIISPFM